MGDVSPNLKGAKCIDTGKDCDLYQSTCEGRTQNCIAFGPGNTMKESTYIIGDRQFQEAKVSDYKVLSSKLPEKITEPVLPTENYRSSIFHNQPKPNVWPITKAEADC